MSQKRTSKTSAPASQMRALAWVAFLLSLGARLQAQGILSVTPGRTAATAAGTGTPGYTGDGNAATSATLAAPSAVAYDANGNLFLADANNHVIREVVQSSGKIVTVAGTGVAGFGGDGGAATSAYLDTPTGIAVDSSGNLYIADSHNQRIRKVTGITISTIAGTGTAGFSGDGAVATAAALNLPSAVAVDSSGNLYIADTNNQRIRKITGTTISTIAGTGEQNYTGDGSLATSATLDSPSGIAVDASGNVFLADRHNQRIREITGGNIATVAGSGSPTFAGGFNGDGATATAATLAKPTGVAVDAAGNLYIADTNNQRLRELAGGAIATIAGTGEQGFAGDGNVATAAVLNAPRAAASDTLGNVAAAEAPAQRVRSILLPVLDFGNQAVGAASISQTIAVSNSGTASLTVSSIDFTGSVATLSGGTCTSPPITLAAGSGCSLKLTFTPGASGATSGSVVFRGAGVVPQTILLSGNGIPVTPTKVVYLAAPPTPLTAGGNAGTVQVALEDGSGNVATASSGTAVTLTVTGPSGYANPYSANTTNGVATFSLSAVPLTAAGAYTYTAASDSLTSAVATETVNPGPASSFLVAGLGPFPAPQMSGTATVKAIDAYGNVAPSFTGAVTLTSTDATATFEPSSYTYTAGDAGTHTFTVTFNTAGTQTVTAASGSLAASETGILVRDAVVILNRSGSLVRTTDDGAQTTAFGSVNGSAASGGIAFDHAGNIWAVTSASNAVQEYTAAGAVVAVPGSGGAGVNSPTSLAIDGSGQVWIANGNGSISVLSASGAAVSPSTGYQPGSFSGAASIVVDNSGSVWVANSSTGSVSKIFGGAQPVVTPTITGTVNNTLGSKP